MNRLSLSVFALMVSMCLSAQADAGWRLVWEDDFSVSELDTTVWRKCARGPHDWNNNMSHEAVCYGWSDGAVVLRGVVTPDGAVAPDGLAESWGYIVGGIETSGLKSFEPPLRIEIRAKTTGAKGAWPALWMRPWSAVCPDYAEIDIIERLNHDSMVYQTAHFGDSTFTVRDNVSTTAEIDGDGWNVYMVEVVEDAVVWSVNGKETLRYQRDVTQPSWRFPFYQPWHLKMDMQLGGSWVGEVDINELPAEMHIDYVRYYRPL